MVQPQEFVGLSQCPFTGCLISVPLLGNLKIVPHALGSTDLKLSWGNKTVSQRIGFLHLNITCDLVLPRSLVFSNSGIVKEQPCAKMKFSLAASKDRLAW